MTIFASGERRRTVLRGIVARKYPGYLERSAPIAIYLRGSVVLWYNPAPGTRPDGDLFVIALHDSGRYVGQHVRGVAVHMLPAQSATEIRTAFIADITEAIESAGPSGERPSRIVKA